MPKSCAFVATGNGAGRRFSFRQAKSLSGNGPVGRRLFGLSQAPFAGAAASSRAPGSAVSTGSSMAKTRALSAKQRELPIGRLGKNQGLPEMRAAPLGLVKMFIALPRAAPLEHLSKRAPLGGIRSGKGSGKTLGKELISSVINNVTLSAARLAQNLQKSRRI
jgi:hypothetical protein